VFCSGLPEAFLPLAFLTESFLPTRSVGLHPERASEVCARSVVVKELK
jgi:hypothetical protein